MCVAVKAGIGVKRAFVLEVGTRWVWDLHSNHQRHDRDPKSVAVAVEGYPFNRPLNEQGFQPDVVTLSNILDTWDEYAATQKKNQEAAQRAYERARRREREFQERFDKLNLSDAQLEANGYVRISLDALEALSRRRVDNGEDRQ
jgi:type I site-specific restriction endonuclease